MTAFVEATAGMIRFTTPEKNILIKIWSFLLKKRYLKLDNLIIKYHFSQLDFSGFQVRK